jgi:hypothetical protein
MHKAIITVYQIAKRITYDFDLLKHNKGKDVIRKMCREKISELERSPFK